MGFTKRRACSKTKVIAKDFVKIQRQYLSHIMAVVLMEEVPHQLIINWDHTAMKVVPATSWTKATVIKFIVSQTPPICRRAVVIVISYL